MHDVREILNTCSMECSKHTDFVRYFFSSNSVHRPTTSASLLLWKSSAQKLIKFYYRLYNLIIMFSICSFKVIITKV
jgi:hypothetical protein